MKTVRITIPFHDKPLVLIDHHEQPFVAMRPIVDGMGMAWPPQRQKLKKRFAATVTEIATVADDGRKRAMLCLPLKQLPSWLNTIHPEKVAPHIRDSIRRYQTECDEVLWQYWMAGEARRQHIRENMAALALEEQASRERGSDAGRSLRTRRMEKENYHWHMQGLKKQLDWLWEAHPYL